jgi:hypothetical protein
VGTPASPRTDSFVAADPLPGAEIPEDPVAGYPDAVAATLLSSTQASVRVRNRRRVVGMTGVAVVAAAATILGLTLTRTTPPPAPAPVTPAPATADAQTAQAVTLESTDIPTGWKVASHPSITAEPSANWRTQLTECLGLPPSADPLGNDPVTTAEHVSSVFAGSSAGAPVEIASDAAVYPSSATVSAELSELSRPSFAQCLEEAEVGTASRVLTSNAAVSPLTLEQVPGVRSVGYQVTIPSTDPDGDNVDFVVVAGGRVSTELVGLGVGQQFPPLVTAAASYSIAKRIAAQEGSA